VEGPTSVSVCANTSKIKRAVEKFSIITAFLTFEYLHELTNYRVVKEGLSKVSFTSLDGAIMLIEVSITVTKRWLILSMWL